jgi:hypothetical protein
MVFSYIPSRVSLSENAACKLSVDPLCLFCASCIDNEPAILDREQGREALIFCWCLLVVVGLTNLHETRLIKALGGGWDVCHLADARERRVRVLRKN